MLARPWGYPDKGDLLLDNERMLVDSHIMDIKICESRVFDSRGELQKQPMLRLGLATLTNGSGMKVGIP